MPSLALALGAVVLAAAPALARTDLTGCTYYDSIIAPSQMAPYNTRIWYVPDTGELCNFLDCGGGRAPPKTTVPGCPQYEGTATYSPSFINPKTLGGAGSGSGAPSTTTQTTAAAATIQTDSATLTTEVRTTAAPIVSGTVAGTVSGSASGSASVSVSGSTGSAAVTQSAKSADSSNSGAPPSASASGGDKATATTGTVATATHSAAAAGLPTAGAVLGPCLLAGVAAGMAIF